ERWAESGRSAPPPHGGPQHQYWESVWSVCGPERNPTSASVRGGRLQGVQYRVLLVLPRGVGAAALRLGPHERLEVGRHVVGHLHLADDEFFVALADVVAVLVVELGEVAFHLRGVLAVPGVVAGLLAGGVAVGHEEQ